jgi:hypothetical protein
LESAAPNTAQAEVEHDLMMPQTLPALYKTEVAYHAIMSAAHPREPRIPKPTHDTTRCTVAESCQILTSRESMRSQKNITRSAGAFSQG